MIHDLPVNKADGDEEKSSKDNARNSSLPALARFLQRGVPGHLRDGAGVPVKRREGKRNTI